MLCDARCNATAYNVTLSRRAEALWAIERGALTVTGEALIMMIAVVTVSFAACFVILLKTKVWM